MSEWVDSEQRPFGWFSDSEGELYRQTVASYPGGVLVELGSYIGRSLSYVLPTCKDLGVEVWAVDLWPCPPQDALQPSLDKHEYIPASHVRLFLSNLKRLGFNQGVGVLQSDSVQAATQFKPESVSMIMVDSLHTYEHTKAEITAWAPKLKPGGTWLFHDYTGARVDTDAYRTDVGSAVRELLRLPDRVVGSLALVKKK